MANFRMVVLGDSVTWGQGLETADKFYSLVKSALHADGCAVLAHSGATIGVGITTVEPPIDGEVPTSYPTILQQCAAFTDSPETVDLVIVNGGINDIDVRTILNPFTDSSDLKDMIRQYCFRDMKTLLEATLAKFTNPACKIVVTGYYPILSNQSHFPLVLQFLAVSGVSLPPFLNLLEGPVFDKILANCTQFDVQSTRMLQRAITQVNEAANGPARALFARPAFGPENAALAPEAWLWGVNPDLTPQDPLSSARKAACNLHETDIIQRQTCYRASTGHPNLIGAQQFAKAIIEALG